MWFHIPRVFPLISDRLVCHNEKDPNFFFFFFFHFLVLLRNKCNAINLKKLRNCIALPHFWSFLIIICWQKVCFKADINNRSLVSFGRCVLSPDIDCLPVGKSKT